MSVPADANSPATTTHTTQPDSPAGGGVGAGQGAEWLAGALLAAGVVIGVVTLMRASRRRARRRRGGSATPAERIEAIRDAARQRDALSNLMVDVEELTRRFAAQLDNKAERLEELLAQADERIERLENATGRRRRGVGPNAAAPDGPPASPNGGDPLTLEVYRLADEGHAPVEIARQLGQHTGKVELILALRDA